MLIFPILNTAPLKLKHYLGGLILAVVRYEHRETCNRFSDVHTSCVSQDCFRVELGGAYIVGYNVTAKSSKMPWFQVILPRPTISQSCREVFTSHYALVWFRNMHTLYCWSSSTQARSVHWNVCGEISHPPFQASDDAFAGLCWLSWRGGRPDIGHTEEQTS